MLVKLKLWPLELLNIFRLRFIMYLKAPLSGTIQNSKLHHVSYGARASRISTSVFAGELRRYYLLVLKCNCQGTHYLGGVGDSPMTVSLSEKYSVNLMPDSG
jgi:hypothetical protein